MPSVEHFELPSSVTRPVSITEEPDYITDDYHEAPISTLPSSAALSHHDEGEEYVIEKPLEIRTEKKSLNKNKKRRQKPRPRKPADLPPIVFSHEVPNLEDSYQPDVQWDSHQDISPKIPFLEDDVSPYDSPHIPEHDSEPYITEDAYPVHHFPDAEYEDISPSYHQPKSNYYYTDPVLESPNQSEYLPAVVEIQDSYEKNKNPPTFSDSYKSSKSLGYPESKKVYAESYVPSRDYSPPYAQSDKPVSLDYSQFSPPFHHNEKVPTAYYERAPEYVSHEPHAYYYASSSELIPELKDIIREPNWDVKDFSKWKHTLQKPYGGTLSGGRGYGRQFPLTAQVDSYDHVSDSGYYKPFAPVEKILSPVDFPIYNAASQSSYPGSAYYSYYPADTHLSSPEIGVETPRPFDIKFDDWLDTSGVEAFGLQVPSDTINHYKHPPSDYQLEAHFESLAEVKPAGKEPFSYTPFKPQISFHESSYQDESANLQLHPHKEYSEYGGVDNIGFRKHNTVYSTANNVGSAASSEPPIPYQETLQNPYANLVPEYQSKENGVSSDYVIKQPYFDNVYLPKMTISPKLDISVKPLQKPTSLSYHNSSAPKVNYNVAPPPPKHEKFMVPSQHIGHIKNMATSKPKGVRINKMPPNVNPGVMRKAPVRKRPIQVNRKTVDRGSIWTDLSMFANKVIDAGHKGLLALGSEENYHYSDMDYRADRAQSDGYTGRNH